MIALHLRGAMGMIFSLMVISPVSGHPTSACPTTTETRTVRGSSLEPLVAQGTRLRLAMDPQHCLPIRRGDLVAMGHAGSPDRLLVKIVRGIPGDRFSLSKIDEGAYRVVVNGKILRNSQGVAYRVDERAHRLLALYERDYAGIIPEGAYLLLGNLPSGSRDSSRFGLVERGDLLGKVLR